MVTISAILSGGRVMAHDVRGHGRDILGDQPGIEPIVLREGAGERGRTAEVCWD